MVRILRLRPVMIAWGLRIHVPSGKRDEVLRILRSLPEPARVRKGCLTCRIYQDIVDPEVLALVQEWASSDDLERYLRSEDPRKFLALMDLATQRPEVWLDTVVIREGFDRLAAVLELAVKP